MKGLGSTIRPPLGSAANLSIARSIWPTREITRRAKGVSAGTTMKELAAYMRGCRRRSNIGPQRNKFGCQPWEAHRVIVTQRISIYEFSPSRQRSARKSSHNHAHGGWYVSRRSDLHSGWRNTR
jgi:hypothetical protein